MDEQDLLYRQVAGHCINCGHQDGDALWLRFSGGHGQFIDPMGGASGQWVALCGTCLSDAPGWVRAQWPWVPAAAGWMPLGECIDCQRNLPLATVTTGPGLRLIESDNVLEVTRALGMLTVHPEPHRLEPSQVARLCHDCAHDFCEQHDAFDALLLPHESHTHTAEFWTANPHHVGQDAPGQP
ncbi:hypothetical protein [Ornithinimicrobium murale]|uniref:hypothetical protein n=1 Tax=Ornithinimicrobium murale TaxID=1050153 RepID=UPI000E0CD9D3|nr:hypothetical protein [Ornithinimicrobium murale]